MLPELHALVPNSCIVAYFPVLGKSAEITCTRFLRPVSSPTSPCVAATVQYSTCICDVYCSSVAVRCRLFRTEIPIQRALRIRRVACAAHATDLTLLLPGYRLSLSRSVFAAFGYALSTGDFFLTL